ncbi:molecular chaperone TorD family protein [candidate division KSB1 bacterium]|nr:molecular chaperone TorD family protein [candidate division KSB1 bacterium]
MNNFKIDETDLALCRSAIYEALALGFRTPASETFERLIAAEQNSALMQIAAMLDASESNGKSTNMASRVRQLRQCAELEALEKSYRDLFGFTAHPKVPPYETEYGEETLFQQPQELGDLAGFYNAFGLKVKASERVDHISCECEFLSFLARKEAYALEQNDADMLEETRKAQRFFLKDHWGRFIPAFVKMLKREDPEGFYGGLGDLCHEFARFECTRSNVPLGSELMYLRPAEWMEEDFTCGSGEELIQISRKAAATMTAN